MGDKRHSDKWYLGKKSIIEEEVNKFRNYVSVY